MAGNTINEKITDKLIANLNNIISSFARPALNTDLDNFKVLFINRYGEEEVALTMALDPDSGIDYGLSKLGKHL